ncbi:glycine decarboxylase subunit T KNAG_0H01390 [Huiozyma naganishii CBS 8797]|uniref:Aminomethyltransferase n=1 Tax=Huiozyma naganishii (strain ATCC MYA-139 / BCRC 22969 / CBS 8797 / KCTC 17520 / NBRC 10181 / NCYC 3082 / Yp74L-3) TaxID=1071383 RepID=J7S1P4_HUIN7|nr:hypothetical protein KNAG_0H01390 [Kazachstania naganishii CBS 8797]CCK71552.1 hypothetical protein KNAG_0H01390 [Kazachstania naganishii CBS 8797]
MVPFAGYSMPLLYPGIQTHVESHRWVRQHAGLFDVSHMLQSKLTGTGAVKLLDKITPTDFTQLQPCSGSLSVLLNKQGGVIDDLMVFREPEGFPGDGFYMVTNASRAKEDSEFIRNELNELPENARIQWESIEGTALIALQGPSSAAVLESLVADPADLKKLTFGTRDYVHLADGTRVGVMRGGYTGEDGFEIAVPGASAEKFAEQLLSNNEVKPIGLAARDSLRLEAGLCLYGNELDTATTPVEANLKWVISKTRRSDADKSRSVFNGYAKIMDQLQNKTHGRVRVGFQYLETTPAPAARTGDRILDATSGEQVGTVTSGSVSPSLSDEATKRTVNIGQAYVAQGHHKAGTGLVVEVRRKRFPITVAKLPLVPTHYYRG